MTRTRRIAVVALTAAIAATAIIPIIGRSAESTPATPPATQPSAAAPATPGGRSQQDIMADLRATSAQLQATLPSIASLTDENIRRDKAATTVPLLKKMASLIGELANTQTQPEAKAGLVAQQHEFYSFLVAFNDKDTLDILQKEAKGTGDTALQAKSSLAIGHWWQEARDPVAQQKTLDEYAAVAKANPASDTVAETLGIMSQLGAANADMSKKALDIARTSNLTSDTAKQLLAQADAQAAQQAMIGKPLTVAGRTTTGSHLSTADLKGKIVLVDFWATWCGPCNAELPRVKQLYKDFHDKGLEIVGVDCDDSDSTVNDFTKAKDMPWPQLREESQKGEDAWHPLAKQWHVDGIPTMFLIDQKGVLRYVDAREGTEEKVKTLLAEAKPAPAPTPAK